MRTKISHPWTRQNTCQPFWLAAKRKLALFAPIASLAAITFSACAFDSPATPLQALAAFQHDPGLKVELVAAEPLVFQPCAIAWDAEGHLYVAENRGYPTGTGLGKPPVGVIVRLDDTDGDGRMDRRIVFADDLTFPNGLMPWKGGLIVACAPDVLFLKDTNGGGRADVRKVLLTGFNTKGSTQLRVSHPTFGPDGWIYLTSGLTGVSRVTSPEHPERPAVEIGTDSRFNPFTLEIEAVGGRGQFGQTFDDAGNRFHCMNRVHIQHTVIAPRYLARNPNLMLSETVQNVPEGMVTDLINGANQNFAARLYSISDNVTTADSHVGTFTAACGVHIYRGDALPAEYRGDAFACDPTGNLVHRDKLTPVGPTFASHMANEGREFLASPDNWFRPVFLATGPDGALYICDMYRKTIEHPDYLPVEVRKRTDFITGRDLGRIWRVTGNDGSPRSRRREEADLGLKSKSDSLPRRLPGLGHASTTELVRALGHPNAWWRENAQRLLVERGDPKTLPILAKCFQATSEATIKMQINTLLGPAGWTGLAGEALPEDALLRLHALRTLAILATSDSGITASPVHLSPQSAAAKTVSDKKGVRGNVPKQLEQQVRASLLSVDPILRENAWRILADHQWDAPSFPAAFFPLFASDPNPRARFWFGLGFGHGPAATRIELWAQVLARLAVSDGTNRWMRGAILSSLKAGQSLQLARFLAQRSDEPAPVEFWADLGRVLGVEMGALPEFFPTNALPSPWLIAALDGVTESVRQHGQPLALPEEVRTRLGAEAARLAVSMSEPGATRKAAIGFLANVDPGPATAALLPLLTAAEPAELQLVAVRALLALPTDTAAKALLIPARWNTLPPGTRAVVVASMLAQPRHVRVLLDAIETRQIGDNILARAQRESLRKHQEESIRQRAQQLFAAAETGDRMKAYEASRVVLSLKGHADNGHKVFATHCASCHRLDREGHNVGPDLFGIRNQPKETILLHIVHPNYEVLPGFNACTVECKDGRELTGLIIGESPTSMTLRQALGIEETIPRSTVTHLTVSQVSLMPDGFEATMSQQELADLLACLKGEGEVNPKFE